MRCHRVFCSGPVTLPTYSSVNATGDDDKYVAFYFEERPEPEVAKNYVHVSAKAIWTEDILDDSVDFCNLEVYDTVCLDSPFCRISQKLLNFSHPGDSLSRTVGSYIWRQVLLVDVSVAKLCKGSP
jgi:hypothetical protein